MAYTTKGYMTHWREMQIERAKEELKLQEIGRDTSKDILRVSIAKA